MDMQRAYIWTSKTSNAKFSYAFFGFNARGHSNQITPYYLKLYFAVSVFLYVPPIFRKHLFLEHFCTMTSISSIEKDSIAVTPDSFKDIFLHVKLAIKWIQTSKKEKFHKQPVVILFKNDCSVRYMFCTIFASLSVAKILENHVESSSYLL